MEKKILDFEKLPRREGLNTDTWEVWNVLQPTLLGVVKWFGRWTQYAFFPEPELVFEKNCLRAIADYCDEQTRIQRKAAAKRRKGEKEK